MKSDIDELLKGSRVTVSKMISPTADQPFGLTQASRRQKIIGALVATFIIIISVSVFFFVLRTKKKDEAQIVKIPPPAPFFSTEASRSITVRARDRLQLFNLLTDSMKEQEIYGTVKRLLIKIQESSGQERYITLTEFLDFYRITPPQNFLPYVEGSLMVFIYYGESGSRLGIAAKISDTDRATLALYSWEPSMSLDLKPLFFEAGVGENLSGQNFEDRVYHNIDWRFLKSLSGADLGISYAVFPARNILLITTSKGSIEKAIDRLFESK